MSDGTVITVAADHPALEGHFPGNPILPGVVILAEVLAAAEREGHAIDGCSVRSAKFLSPARPGDRLRIALTARAGRIDFVVSADERRIASGTVDIGNER